MIAPVFDRDLFKQDLGTRISWALTAKDPEGEWDTRMAKFPTMTVMVAGGSIRLLGAHAEGEDGVPLADALGQVIRGPGMYFLRVNPVRIRPVLLAGETVTVSLFAV